MFAMASIEIIPTFANSVKDAIYFVGFVYIWTIALNLVASPNTIN